MATMNAVNDAQPIHRVYVDGFWMDKTDVTNEEFARFAAATGYVTIAERTPTKEEYPNAPPEALVAGSDIVKDDELLVDPPYCPIGVRAALCVKAAREAEQKTGERKMWVLHLGCDISRFDEFFRIGESAKLSL